MGDHELWYPDCNTTNIYITTKQDVIIAYCRSKDADSKDLPECGTINVSNILTGKSMMKLDASKYAEYRTSLEGVTALFYNEDRNEIYSGTLRGELTIWSN